MAALFASVFTTGIRHLFDEGVPLFAIDAPRQGSGKSKLVKCISNLWFVRPASVTPYSNDPEEMKKHLASMLLNGDRVVLFDNVPPTTKVNDPTLNALLTSGRITFRELGSQRMLDMDTAATFFMTGNNLKIIGDMIRRTIRMQIDPEGLHPMDRKFKIDPVEAYILEHRVELLSAALTILVAFFNAGCPVPKGVSALASFERWSELIRNMLLWLGMEDVKECISQGYEADDESMEIEHLLELLSKIPELTQNGLSSTMLLPIAENNKALKDAMLPFMSEKSHGITHPRVVTTVLSQVAKIPVKGRRLLRLGPVWVMREGE
jgi:putative DNA primase/helicase